MQENEGEHSKIIRKKKAYAALKALSYEGPRKHWTLSQYTAGHQHAHNELEDCGEPVPETKKVDDWLTGIAAPELQAGKDFIQGDPVKLNSFETAHQYLGALAAGKNVHQKSQRARGIGSLGQDLGRDNGGKKSLHTGYRPWSEWMALIQDERADIDSRRTKKGGGKGKQALAKKRKAAAAKVASAKQKALLQQETEEEDDEIEEAPAGAGGQFGRTAHKAKKARIAPGS